MILSLVAVSNIVVSAFALADKLGDEVFSGHATRSALTAYNGILGIWHIQQILPKADRERDRRATQSVETLAGLRS